MVQYRKRRRMQEGGTTTEEEQPKNRPITTDQELLDEVGNLAAGNVGGVPQVNAVLQGDPKDKELLDSTKYTVGVRPNPFKEFYTTGDAPDDATSGDFGIAAEDSATTQGGKSLIDLVDDAYEPAKAKQVYGSFDVDEPKAKEGIGQAGEVTKIKDSLTDMDAAQIEDSEAIITKEELEDIQGKVSDGSLAVAQTEDLDERATTRYQLGELMDSLEEGKPPPAWASPAIRKVSAIMQSRGMGASSMAAAAMTQAVMESGVTIASQDANKYANIQLTNLNNKQKTALQNALTVAAMDRANLNARLKAAVTNAQSLLTIDVKNLDAQQQTNAINYNALTQALFKDTAEINAREAFNAKNEMQVEQFFAELEAQVETANENRKASIEQFNVGQENTIEQFNATLRDSRQKFDANMKFAVDQSNVNWRRQINTADTATQNETNRINVQNQYNASQNALNNYWQKLRDNASWNFQKIESLMQRQHEIGIMAMEFANSEKLYDKQQRDDFAKAAGNWVANWLEDSLDDAAEEVVGTDTDDTDTETES